MDATETADVATVREFTSAIRIVAEELRFGALSAVLFQIGVMRATVAVSAAVFIHISCN